MADLTSTWYSRINDVNRNQWNNVVSQADRSTVFHRYEWLRAVEDAFDDDARHVVVEKRGNPVAVMPNFVRRLPIPDGVTDVLPIDQPFEMVVSSSPGYGGPITVANEREAIDRIFDTLEGSVGRRVIFHRLQTPRLANARYGKYLEMRGYEPSLDTCLFFIDLGEGWETILENMDKERRKDVRTAHEQDYRVEVRSLESEIDPTYDAYVENVERVDGNVLPRTFMEAVAERLGDDVRVFTAVVDDEEVGRYVHLLDRDASVLRHWLSAIPDTDYYDRHPAELLHERAIKWGIEHGFEDYGFGPTGAHFSNSVFRFKKKYGGAVVPLIKLEKGYAPLRWRLFKFARMRYVSHIH